MKTRMKELVFIPLIIIFLTAGMIISYKEFRIWNPFVTLNGIVRISILGEEYYEIQEYPKIIIANKNFKLEDYMRNLGYEPVETDNDSISENIYEFKASESGSFVEVTKHIIFMFGCGENNKTETRVNVTILQEVICRMQVTFFDDFCKKWAISVMDIDFRLKDAILQLKTA